jgi:error-prone DNA polymerase
MGWRNPPVPWSELERRLSDRPPNADGGDSPAWGPKRADYRPPPIVRPATTRTVPYAELHSHSAFSFLDGASPPEELVEEAARLGLDALALTDHDGFYGIVRFAEAARALGLPAAYGAELTLDLWGAGAAKPPAQAGLTDPEGRHLVVVARDPVGYGRLARAVSTAHLSATQSGAPSGAWPPTAPPEAGCGPGTAKPLDRPPGVGPAPCPNRELELPAREEAGCGPERRGGARPGTATPLEHGEKNLPRTSLADLAGVHGGHWLVLTGCRKGAVPAALVDHGPAAAARELAALVDAFGRENVAVELWDHGDPLDSVRNDALAALAVRAGLDVVATNNVHYATPARRPLATALAAVRARRSLDEIDGWLPPAATAHLRSGAEQARRFARYPGAVERAAEYGRACAFDLSLVAPRLPDYPVPPGHTEMSWLRELTRRGEARRYPDNPKAHAQIQHELAVIEALGFPGYFLIVWDIVEFCRRNDIYCQGRGSAANSAVCYALGITKADAVGLGLLFERFLSPERDGPPDIDVDIEHERREEAIQYVYERYGRENAAQVANVITYRPKSAVRDMGKALGHPPGALDAWSKQIEGWWLKELPDDTDIPRPVLELARQVEGYPRHLGIHSGGMVICDRPVVEVCPVEWARMPGRTVLQWDKDDCAAAGLVKIDLLGLGMLTALHLCVDMIREHHGVDIDLAAIPQEDAVYDMLCQADSVGVFQVESRAQMATLPRLKPRTFYDLVVEVALIRPGPIQGGSVHPYIRRRNGQEPVTYLHPLLEKSLAKTLGVPLFQEQLMQMAIDVADFTPGEADQLRQAMGSKRSHERMEALRGRLYEGMAAKGITGGVADQIYDKLAAFADFGFPESHSVSFAYLVYASAWLKLHYPAAFLAALLNSQPMGFYSPNTLVADARRHGVVVLGPDVNASDFSAQLHRRGGKCAGSSGTPGEHPAQSPPMTGTCAEKPEGPAVRLGLEYVRNLGEDMAKAIAAGRLRAGAQWEPYESMEDLVRRTGVGLPALEALATAGAFGESLGLSRREALWAAGAVAQARNGRLPGVVVGTDAPPLPAMSEPEVAAADLWATGISADRHPAQFARPHLEEIGAVTVAALAAIPHGRRIAIGGIVTHRQRPATAQGVIFLNIEDETGMANVICSAGVWARHRRLARTSPALIVRGRLERAEGAINVVAERLEHLPLATEPPRSRDFR